MTFLEAAIEVLRQVGRPLSVRELTERAIRDNLLSHQGRAPEETMELRLKQELKKGDRTPLVQAKPGVIGLRRYDAPAASPKRAEPAARAVPAARAAPAAPADDTEAGKKKRRRRGGRGRKRAGDAGTSHETETETETEAAAAEASPSVEAGTPEEAIAAAELAGEPADEATSAAGLDAMSPLAPRRYPRVVALPSDEELSEQYADEVDAGAVAPPVAGEVIDAQSADEDRPMLAEIKETRERDRRGRGRKERKERPKDDRKEKKERRGKRTREEVAPAPAPSPPPPARSPAPPPAPAPSPSPVAAPAAAAAHPVPAPAPVPVPVPSPEIGGDIVEVSLNLLRSLNDPRPVHARQLAAMALKRKLLSGDPEEVWRAIRSALAGDARLRQAQGLRIRARHQGAGLFTLTTARLEDNLRAAEEALAGRWQDLGRATFAALAARVGRLPLAALEQLARIYLGHAGVRDVVRVKRANETWYLSGAQKRGSRTVRLLVGVRSGGGEVGRQAIGELRAGIEAKGLDEGLLLAAGRLSPDGARELEAGGRPVTVFAGESLAEELAARGVGVVRTNLPVAYLDIDLLAELSES